MSKESFVFLLGAIVLFTPFLGIPRQYKDILFIGCGILLIVLGYLLRRRAFLRSLEQESGERIGDAFVESRAIEPSSLSGGERPVV